MTKVLLQYGSPAPDGTYPPVEGVLIWTPTRRRVIAGMPDKIIMPIGFKVPITGGVITVNVAPSGIDWVWRVDELVKGANRVISYRAVPDVDEIDFTDLVGINPTTLQPMAEPEPIWYSWAEGLALAVANAEQTAEDSKNVAIDSQDSAQNSAIAAAGSATEAAESAVQAGGHASYAGSSAFSAGTSAATALGHKNDAEAAEAGAQAAESNAILYRDQANIARTAAETARSGAEDAETGAGFARFYAEMARTEAETLVNYTITEGAVDDDGHLILTRTDNTPIDAGYVIGPPTNLEIIGTTTGFSSARAADADVKDLILDTASGTRGVLNTAIIDKAGIEQWKPSTAYVIGQRVIHPNGDVKVSLTNHTSSSSSPGTINWGNPPAITTEITERKRDLARQRRRIERDNPRRTVLEPFPAEFGWDPGIKVFYNGSRWFTNHDVSSRKLSGGTKRYVNTATGSNTNDGLSEATAYLSLNQAYSVSSDNDEIVIVNKGVTYRNQASITGLNVEKSLKITAKYPGETYLTSADVLTYTAHATYAGVWQVSRTNVLNVVDISVDTEGYRYPKQAVVADLATSMPGTWAHDGTILYIKTLDGLIPDNTKILALLDANLMNFVGSNRVTPMNIYLEGIHHLGGQNGVKAINTSANKLTFVAKNCKFLWSGWTSADAVPILGNVDFFAQNCVAANSGKDGFNYHIQGGYLPRFVEIDCIGHSNGLFNVNGDYTMNGSTAHDGVKGIRIGGKYHHTMGTPVADVNLGTITLNYSCDSWDSLAPIGSGYNAAWAAQQTGVIMYLYGCRGWGTDMDVYNVTGATMYLINSEYDTKQGAGTYNITNTL